MYPLCWWAPARLLPNPLTRAAPGASQDAETADAGKGLINQPSTMWLDDRNTPRSQRVYMDWAGDSGGHSSVGASGIMWTKRLWETLGAYDLRDIYGQPRPAAHPSLFRRADRLMSRRTSEGRTYDGVGEGSRMAAIYARS
jgi:hypothetical protein